MSTKRVDLHLHTFHSDGTFTPEELIRRAKSAGLSAVSITDHESILGLPAARCAAANDLEIIPGVELTVAFQKRDLHLLGYGFNEGNPQLGRYLEQAHRWREGRMQAMIDRLKERGVQVTLEEVQAVSGEGNSMGRPHLAEVLVKRGVVQSISQAFEQYIGDRACCFAPQATLTVNQAVQLVRQAGGVVVLAHPRRMVEDEWIPELVSQGIQGIEVYHSDHNRAATQHYQAMADRLGLLGTGGSDCHGLRGSKGPLIGTVPVPYACLERLRELFQPR